jgi:4-hydroxybenzoate polyprenyltransferase
MSLAINENNLPFIRRLFIYQKERFPLLGHGLLVAAFSFSAISYSRICRGAEGFVSLKVFLVGIFTTVSLFLLVRIFDEFKDREEDAAYRKYLPVPRGLISLKELKIVGIVTVVLQLLLNLLFFPKMLLIYFLIIIYLCLMGKEFFVSEWLKKHQFWYVTSHMFIIPFIDIYASGLDWFLADVKAPVGLIFFFAVSYMNGIVLEIGRKIKPPGSEEEGVNSYTKMLGVNNAPLIWIIVLFVTFFLAVIAAQYAGYGKVGLLVLSILFICCSLPAIIFLKNKTIRTAKSIELSSALWTIAMYLSLGGFPMIQKLFFN